MLAGTFLIEYSEFNMSILQKCKLSLLNLLVADLKPWAKAINNKADKIKEKRSKPLRDK